MIDFELIRKEIKDRGLEQSLAAASSNKGIDPLMLPLTDVLMLKGFSFLKSSEGHADASERDLVLWMDMNYGTDMRLVVMPGDKALSIDAHTLQPMYLPLCISPHVEVVSTLGQLRSLAKAVHGFPGHAQWLVATASSDEPFESRLFSDYRVPLLAARQSVRPLAEHLYRRL